MIDTKNESGPVHITMFSDVLCIWAYVAQIRVDELKKKFGTAIAFDYRFMALFGDTQKRIAEGWHDRGGFAGFNKHVHEVAKKFPHVVVHPDIWLTCQPKSSAATHLYLKAAQLAISRQSSAASAPGGSSLIFENFIWQVRLAFFRDNRDVSSLQVLNEIAVEHNLPVAVINELLSSGEAMAALCGDVELKDQQNIEGSPTFLLNEGRQKLYGNVGYRILEANIQEVLELGLKPGASWC